MRKYLDIHGKYIYSQKGRKLGFIDNAIISYKYKAITSYIVSSGGLISKIYIVPLKNVHYKDEKIFINTKALKCKKRKLKRLLKYSAECLINKKILNKENKFLGEVEDFIIDCKTGNIKAFICERGFFDDILTGKKVILINNVDMFLDKVVAYKDDVEIINEIAFKNYSRDEII